MRKSKLTLYDVYVQTGLAAELEARGEERKKVEVARNLINLGLPLQTVISATGIDPEKAKALCPLEG